MNALCAAIGIFSVQLCYGQYILGTAYESKATRCRNWIYYADRCTAVLSPPVFKESLWAYLYIPLFY